MRPAWTISTREEVIAALWFIVALLAELAGHSTWAFLITIKATIDMLGAIYFAIVETRNKR